jgi:hypothetical protein
MPPTLQPTPLATIIPEAPPAIPNTSTHNDGFSPSAIIGIVVAIVFLLLVVPLIAILLRRYEKKRVRETPRSPGNSSASLRSVQEGDSLRSVQEGHSLRSILVTKELSRSSLRMERVDSGVRTPENVYEGGRERERGWSRTEVRGGEAK